MEIIKSKGDEIPIFMCVICGDTEGLATDDYKKFVCLKCGWVLELTL
jgi:transcription initiation factor TFIIIB Brf1 subunit/transcription initiation factor TFIIB